ncbi:MAG: SMR family transporter [Cytophagales bacterium]|nr:SMR family transporter [Cytophagales bacterium]
MSWIYLILASLMEICWVFSLKYLNFEQIRQINLLALRTDYAKLTSLLPLAGYIVFGLSNVFLFSNAIKEINIGIGFAVWMSLAMAGTFIMDAIIFKQSYSLMQLVSIALITIGVAGLKYFTPPNE